MAMGSKVLDPAIIAALPASSDILSVVSHGDTRWSTGWKIDIELDDNKKRSYFLKIIEDERLVGMAEAEYEGQEAISSLIPDNASKPISWGYFRDDKTRSWFLTSFRDLKVETPPLLDFLTIVKKMHQESQSPTGKFGFHVVPFYGPPPMTVDWTDSWEHFWTREFRSGIRYTQRMRGTRLDLVEVSEQFIAKVVPRLLRPLQTGGRNIKPSLCHGDLWDGNIQIDKNTGQPVIFDPCPFYGHAEMDLQCMRSERYKVGSNFVGLYERFASEPRADFDDRNALYAIRNDVMTAGMLQNYAYLIDKAINEMRRLLEKHPDGLDGFRGDLTPTVITGSEERAIGSIVTGSISLPD